MMMNNDYEALCDPERIPFSVVAAPFAMASIDIFYSPFLSWVPFCHGCHGIFPGRDPRDDAAAQWGHKKQLSDHPHWTRGPGPSIRQETMLRFPELPASVGLPSKNTALCC